MANHQTKTDSRVDWVDYAKGICIIWVVALYSTDFVQQTAQSIGWMQYAAEFARPFRMPDFFLISGLFVARVLNRPLRSYLDSKVLYFVYFYALWATFKFVHAEWHALLGPDSLALIPAYLRLYVEPPTGPLWFIYILAVFFITVRLVRRLPVWLVLVAAAALEIADFDTGVKVFDKFAHYFVFFYAGHVFAQHVFRGAELARTHVHATVAILAVWLALHTTLVVLQETDRPGMPLIMGFVGAGAILLVSTLLARVTWMEWLGYLGRNSIVLYLGFVVPLGLMRHLIVGSTLITDVGSLSLIATVVSVAGALLIFWTTRNTPLRFLFARPAWASIMPPRMSSAVGVKRTAARV